MGSRGPNVINLVANFPNPWKGRIQQEIAAIGKNAWAPSIDDFAAVATNSVQVDHFYQLLGVVLKQPKGRVDRVNIFTHSNPRLIAFKGTITPRSTFAEVRLDVASALSLEMLEKMTPSVWFQVGRSKKRHTVADVREHFAKGAKVYFYSCKSATDVHLLQEFANTFQVTAVGFKDNICFCPTYSGNRIDRRHVGLGKRCSDQGANFAAVDARGVARKPKP